MKTWPDSRPASVLRLILLASILFFVLWVRIAIRSFDPGPAFLEGTLTLVGARVFEAVTKRPQSYESGKLQLDAKYSLSLMNQTKVSLAVQQYYRKSGMLPASVRDLEAQGVPSRILVDPWKRPLLIHTVSPTLFAIQSTGPSGINSIDWNNPQKIKDAPKVQLVDGNLVVLSKIDAR